MDSHVHPHGGVEGKRVAPRVLVWMPVVLLAVGAASVTPGAWSAEPPSSATPAQVPRALPPPAASESLALADAVLRALENNLDISVSRQTRDIRLTDVVFEQAKFDPTVSVGGRWDQSLQPLNRPIFGFSNQILTEPQEFNQNISQINVGVTQKVLTGANYDLTYNPNRTFVAGQTGFLFNPAFTNSLVLNLTQPLLRDFGLDTNRTLIRVAQNNAKVEQNVFFDRVLTVISTVEQTYWELVFARENLKVTQAALKAAEELLASNRAKAKAGVMAVVEVLQAEAAVASRLEQVLIAEKAIRDQQDQLRRLLNPAEQELRQEFQVVPLDEPVQALEPLSLEEAIDTGIARRPEIRLAMTNTETADLNVKFARNQLMPSLNFQGTAGLGGLGSGVGDMLSRSEGQFYNLGAGLLFSYPLGNRSAWSQFNRRQLESTNAKATLQSARQTVIVSVKEAVRRVQTDFKRIETTRSARIMSEKQLQAEQERLNVGLSTTRFVLDFQRDLAIARGNELRAIVDYNKSLSNLARNKGTTLERYQIELR